MNKIQIQIMPYWDIDSFLAEQQPSQLRFINDTEGMSFLDSSKGLSGTVPAESPLNVAIWIISTLNSYMFIKDGGEVLKPGVPKFFRRDENQGYYRAHQTDRTAKLESLNLREKCAYFYEVYEAIYKILQKNPNLILPQQIKDILLERGAGIIQRACMHQEQTKAQIKFNNYTEFERSLFRVIRAKVLQYEKWEAKKKE